MKQIPNIFTLLNLTFGCLAIVYSLQNGIGIQYSDEGAQFIEVPEQFWMASLFIGLAALVDFLDGFVARLFNASSEMGKQLDSLADVVSFGAAPSIILYQFLRMSYAREESGLDASVLYLVPAFILAGASAFRLAKFNLDDSQQYSFKGVPTPAVGLLIASFPLLYWHAEYPQVVSALLNKWVLYGIILFLSWMMVSNVRMMSLKFKDRSLKNNISKIILLCLAILSAFVVQWLAVAIIFIAYIIISFIFKNDKHDIHSTGKSNAT